LQQSDKKQEKDRQVSYKMSFIVDLCARKKPRRDEFLVAAAEMATESMLTSHHVGGYFQARQQR
jgi:hypothetical protein